MLRRSSEGSSQMSQRSAIKTAKGSTVKALPSLYALICRQNSANTTLGEIEHDGLY